MLSNKLTFSLASLVVLFAMVFAPTTVMAHRGHTEPHPQVTIREYTDAYSVASPRSRSNYQFLVEFTLGGKSDATLFASPSAPTVAIVGLTGDPSDADINITAPSPTQVTDKHAWIYILDLSDTGTVATILTARQLEITVSAAGATAADDANADTTEQANEEKVMTLSNLPSVTASTVSLMVAPKMDANDMAIAGEYTVTFTFSAALSTDEAAAFNAGALVVDPDTFMVGNPTSATTPAANVNKVFTLPITLPRSINRVTIGVDSGFAAITAGSVARVAIPIDGTGNGGGATTLAQPTGVMVAPNTAGDAYEVSWTEPTDKTGIGGYYVMHNPTVFVAVGMTKVSIGTTKPTSVTVWSTADTSDMSPTSAPTGAVMVSAADIAALADLTTTGGGGGTSTMSIGANGFLVLVHSGAEMSDHGIDNDVPKLALSNMPNLAEFFSNGGIITLNGPAGTDKDAVKISEIMWGTDASIGGNASENDDHSQWIELYNRTGADIDLGDLEDTTGWSISFSDRSRLPTAVSATAAGAVDHVGNIGVGGYWEAKGSSGRTESTENADAKTLVSMYRKLKDFTVDKGTNHGLDDGDPHLAGTWVAAAKPSRNLRGTYRTGSPGDYPPTRISATPTAIDRSTVYITEIGNLADGSDWIELYNASSSAVNIKNWIISVVDDAVVKDKAGTYFATETKNGSAADKQVVQFGRATYEDALNIPAGRYLLVTAKSPEDNDLATGINLKEEKADRDPTDVDESWGATHLYYVDSGLKIPNNKHLLILRNNHEKEGQASNIRDIVSVGDAFYTVNVEGKWDTQVWPLQATVKPGDLEDHATLKNVTTPYVMTKRGGVGDHNAAGWWHKDTWTIAPFSGVGYDRDVSSSSATNGTPGYSNGAVKEKVADLGGAEVSISEIMIAAGNGRLPQWIELYNSSMTEAVNLNGWKLEFQNYDSEDMSDTGRINITFTLPDGVKIQPNQTALIVSTEGRNSGSDHFPDTRVIDLWGGNNDEFDRDSRWDPVLSQVGFYLILTDKDNKTVDEVGNLDGKRRTDDEPAWDLPDGTTEDGRSSIIRRYDSGLAEDGTDSMGWILADMTQLGFAREDTYYGSSDDIGTPGFRGGGPLPVSLSSFRPARDKATGAVVIRWVTESELNNAGFNILRSEAKTGEFKVVNTKGIIPGHGTTSEKHVYTWTDTTAKPNVVYYYQIEDVSLDGNRTTLRTTHLRGNVNAAGKLTTYWGELKTYGK